MTSVPFFLAFFVIVVALAMRWGGGPERVTAGAYAVALAASASVGFLRVPGDFRVVPAGLFLADAALLVALAMIAVWANRWWLIPAAGCQLVAVLVHASKLLYPGMVPKGYEFLTDIWSWPMVALLATGVFMHRRRLHNHIFVRDWKPISRRAQLQSPPNRRQR